MVMWYGPCLKGLYGNGSVLYTSQAGYGVASGRLKSTGVHTPGGLSGVLKLLPFPEAGFSRSGDFSLCTIDLLRLINLVARSQANRTATIPAYRNCLASIDTNVVTPAERLFVVQERNSDAIVA